MDNQLANLLLHLVLPKFLGQRCLTSSTRRSLMHSLLANKVSDNNLLEQLPHQWLQLQPLAGMVRKSQAIAQAGMRCLKAPCPMSTCGPRGLMELPMTTCLAQGLHRIFCQSTFEEKIALMLRNLALRIRRANGPPDTCC